jgi:hypothetical protein
VGISLTSYSKPAGCGRARFGLLGYGRNPVGYKQLENASRELYVIIPGVLVTSVNHKLKWSCSLSDCALLQYP